MIKKFINNFISKSSEPSVKYVPVMLSGNNDKSSVEIETKSSSGSGNYLNLMFGYSQCSLAAYLALDYYAKIQPVNSSIDKITEEMSSIDPVVINTETDEIIYDHDVLNVLTTPNPFCRYSEFIKSVTLNYLVTGNAFIVASGNLKEPAKELSDVNPRYVELELGDDGYIQRIIVSSQQSRNLVFNRVYIETDGRRVARYINSNNKEIFHIRNNNPYGYSDSPWGFSRLTPIIYEMEQYLHSNKHNLSLLTKGGRPSMAFTPENPLTDEQFTNLQTQIQSHVAGSSNAGTILLFPQKFESIEMSVSNKDMDYESLRKNIISAIHTQLGVPLPLVMAEQMTLANMQSAMAQFYQNTVIPVANRIFNELTDALMGRYKDKDKMIISFDRRAIPALEFESVESVKMKASLNVMTDNEIRSDIGLEHVDGADKLYKPAGMVPVGSSAQQTISSEAFDRFADRLKNLKDKEGRLLFSNDKVEKILKKYTSGK